MQGHIYSQSARIDIATNFASFDAIDFSVDFPDFLDGDFRVRHLLTLIHEATHHWCLITPVGTALAARTFRTYHDAAVIAIQSSRQEPSRHERQGMLDASIWSSRTVTNFFVPLLEGLALYAEWRACPNEGGTYSRPFVLFQMLTARGDGLAAHDDIKARLVEAGKGLTSDQQASLLKDWLNSEEGRKRQNLPTFS